MASLESSLPLSLLGIADNCRALGRQHPRDVLDVLKMLEQFGWQPSFVDFFVAYLAGDKRSVHEVLFPKALAYALGFPSPSTLATPDTN